MGEAVTGAVVLLVGAALAATTAWRVAGWAGARGGERVVAAAVAAASALVAATWLLSLLQLAGSRAAWLVLLGAGWLASRNLRAAERAPRLAWGAAAAAAGAGGGALTAIAGYHLVHPGFSYDGLTYHLGTTVRWIQSGSVFERVETFYDFPTSAYPAINETLLVAPLALGSAPWPSLVWTALLSGMLAIAAWTGLRAAGAPRIVSALAPAALLSTTLAVRQFSGPLTDLASVAWLVAAASLAITARGRPPVAALALLACGLAVGTKTTALLPAIAIAVLVLRSDPSVRTRLVHAAGAAAVLIGGFVLIRNAIEHGSPLWPFHVGPFGDPRPPAYDQLSHSLLDRPGRTLEGRLTTYRVEIGGGVLLLAGAAAAFASRDRAARWLALGSVVMLVAWSAAPVTGITDDPYFSYLSISVLRYMLPGLAVAAAAVAIASRSGPRARLAVAILLGLTVLYGFRGLLRHDRDADLIAPLVPLAGAFAGVVLARLMTAWRPSHGVVAAMVSLTVVLGGALATDGLSGRHANLEPPGFAARLFVDWAGVQDDRPVASSPFLIGLLAGDHLQHRLDVIGREETCAQIVARLDEGWLVVGRWDEITDLPADQTLLTDSRASACLAGVRPTYANGPWRIYAPRD